MKMMMTKKLQRSYLVKICGNKFANESLKVASYQPDIMGWIFSPKSPRQIVLKEAEAMIPLIRKNYQNISHAAVFAENTPKEIIDVMRMKGLFDFAQVIENADFIRSLQNNPIVTGKIVASIRVKEAISDHCLDKYGSVPFFVLDAFVENQLGGTGKIVNAKWIKKITKPYLLAGGLNPQNVAQVLSSVHAIGADVSSGLEDGILLPGRKNKAKIASFVKTVRKLQCATE